MASHKRVDSAADIVINNAAGHDLSTQIQPVQAFLDAARNLAALEGPSIVQALMGRVKELEDSLKASDDLLKGCKHFNRDLQTEIQDLTTLDKANKAKVSEFAREREQLQATKVEDDKKLQDLQSSKRELEARFGNLERQLKAEKETTTKLRDTLSKTTDTLETRTTEAQELRKSEQALNKRCSKADQEISHIRKLTTRLDDEDQHKMIERMDVLWQHMSSFVLEHFCRDLPLHVLKHDDAWNELRAAVPNVPLPSSNSASAKHMRFAAVATVIIKAMDDRLFHPTYVFGEGRGIREALLQQAENDLNQERLCRSVILSVCPDSQVLMAELRIEDAVDDIVDILGPELMDDHAIGALRGCMEAAHGLWNTTKTSRNLYHLSFEPLEQGDPESASIDLSVIDDSKVDEPAVMRGLNDDVLTVVFPRVYIAGKPRRQLSSGKVLRRYQAAVATLEVGGEGFRRPQLGKGTSRPKPQPNRVRRRSVVPVEHDGVLRQSAGKAVTR